MRKKAKKTGRRPRQEGKRYYGVYWARGAWVAYFAAERKQIQLGRYKFEDNAAWAADFARYMLFGCDYSLWPTLPNGRRREPPNFFPAKNQQGDPDLHDTDDEANQGYILRLLFRNGFFDPPSCPKADPQLFFETMGSALETMRSRLQEYKLARGPKRRWTAEK